MRRALAVAALTLAAPTAAHAATSDVMIPSTVFSPATVQVLAGDQVRWMNHDSRPHTATADGGTFDTGSIPSQGEATAAFPTVGSFPYHCQIHPFMHGTVNVVALVLAGPASNPAKGAVTSLAGRAAAGIPAVTLERAAGGTWAALATTTPGANGSFSFGIRLDAPATFRVHAGTAVSGAVTVRPVDLHLRLSARRRSRTTYVVSTRVVPAAAGTLVVFQRYVPERFAWRTIARRRTDRAGLARIRLRAVVRTRVRTLVRTGGLEIASPSLRIGRRPPFG